MCRLLPASTIGEAVYGDEMSDFECLTTQPGCQQMCYNQFSPMTHTRFWSMHVSFFWIENVIDCGFGSSRDPGPTIF